MANPPFAGDIKESRIIHKYVLGYNGKNKPKSKVGRDILFIEGMKDYLRIWTTDTRIMTLMNFKKMLEILPANNFIRIHKSYILAIDKIDSIERRRVKIAGELLPVGESYKREFFERIEKQKL